MRHVWQEDIGFRKTIILNKSLAAATGDYVVLLDGDCVPHRRFVADHARLAERNFWVQGRRCFVREKFAAAFSTGATPIFRWILRGRITGWAKAIRLPFPIVRRNTGQRGIIGCNMGFWRDDLLASMVLTRSMPAGESARIPTLAPGFINLGRPRKFVYGHAVVYHLEPSPARPRPCRGQPAALGRNHPLKKNSLRTRRRAIPGRRRLRMNPAPQPLRILHLNSLPDRRRDRRSMRQAGGPTAWPRPARCPGRPV